MDAENKLYVLPLSKEASLPTKGSDFAAGFDLYSAHSATIPPFSNALIQTDLSPTFPDGCYGRIAGRSGLALYNKIRHSNKFFDLIFCQKCTTRFKTIAPALKYMDAWFIR